MQDNSVEKKLDTRFVFIFKLLYLIFSFYFIDIALRVLSKEIGEYGLFEIQPTFFSYLYAILFCIIVLFINNTTVRRVVYGCLYYLFSIYAIIQYGYFKFFSKFLYLSDLKMADEGIDFLSMTRNIIDIRMILYILFLILVGIVGIVIVPQQINSFRTRLVLIGLLFISIVGIFLISSTFKNINYNDMNYFSSPEYEYATFTYSGYDMEITGLYHYIVRDLYVREIKKGNSSVLQKSASDYEKDRELINEYFEKKTIHTNNDMSGVFSDKNVILVLMESMDDWLINEKDTPNIYYMMNNGVNFTNFYTPDYSPGYTFNTEFAVNAGIYPYSDGRETDHMVNNTFNRGILSGFIDDRYRARSFHYGAPSFYNRRMMHLTFGYEDYVSFQEFSNDEFETMDDTFLVKNDDLFYEMISGDKFFSFVITYTPHAPYDKYDDLSQYALNRYKQYDDGTDLGRIKAKARITDDMFGDLLKRLREEGLAEDTVIIAFADHYAYGYGTGDELKELSLTKGSDIFEKTPFFIYLDGSDYKMNVDKVCQPIDIAPTISNMFGYEVKNRLGYDIFDDDYKGFALFPGYRWIYDDVYYKKGKIEFGEMSNDDIKKINKAVEEQYKINDMILDTDYFSE